MPYSAEDFARVTITFLPTIVVAALFLLMSFVEIPTAALQQMASNMTLMHALPRPAAWPPPPPPPPQPQTFLFVGRLRCKRGGAAEVMRLLEPLAEAVQRTEPHTLTYQVLRSDRDPDELLLLERYRSRADMLEPHKSSTAFVEFKRQLALLGVVEEKTGSSWLSTGVGFASRDPAEARLLRRRAALANASRTRRNRPRPRSFFPGSEF
tara:strand:- start:38 stop:664 length:627 start_codon:yes stop_codon:yes gene_type:complete